MRPTLSRGLNARQLLISQFYVLMYAFLLPLAASPNSSILKVPCQCQPAAGGLTS